MVLYKLFHVLALCLMFYLLCREKEKANKGVYLFASPYLAKLFDTPVLENTDNLKKYGIDSNVSIERIRAYLRGLHLFKDILITFQNYDMGFFKTSNYNQTILLLFENLGYDKSQVDNEITSIIDTILNFGSKDLKDEIPYFGLIKKDYNDVKVFFVYFRLINTGVGNVWSYSHFLCKYVKLKKQ